MEFDKFKTVIEKLEKVRERSHSMYGLGIDLLEYDEQYHIVISTLLHSVFSEEGTGWIDWYLYERIGFDSKVKLATDKDGNEICYDIPSLWETVKEHLKTK
jgi:hypothetical protein